MPVAPAHMASRGGAAGGSAEGAETAGPANSACVDETPPVITKCPANVRALVDNEDAYTATGRCVCAQPPTMLPPPVC